MSWKNNGLLENVADIATSDPPGVDDTSSYAPIPQNSVTSPTTPTQYGSHNCTVSVQQPNSKFQDGFSDSGKNCQSIIVPVSTPSSEDEITTKKPTSFVETNSGNSSRAASETHLLVPDDVTVIDNTNVDVSLIDPDTAGIITLWNGIKVHVADFINKERYRKEVEPPLNDFSCCLRLWSIIGHFGVLVCLPLLLWLLLTRTGRELEEEIEMESAHKIWFTTPVALTSLFLGLSYLLILCDAFTARNRPYMAHLMSLEDAHSYVMSVRKKPPKIMIKVKCYHYVENSIGKPRKTITYEEQREFNFDKCEDVSGYLHKEDFPPGYVTKVKMRRMFGFLNQESEEKYKLFKSSIIDRCTHKDVYIDVEEVMEIDSLQDKISVFLDCETKPTCVDYGYYWLTAVCFLTLPYRYWFSSRTRKTAYTYVKLIGV